MSGVGLPRHKKEGRKGHWVGVIQTRQSFQPGHKDSKDLFVLNVSWERVVSDEVVHGNKGNGRFAGVGRAVSNGVRVMIRPRIRGRLGRVV